MNMIRTDIPMPIQNDRHKWPFDRMKVGNCLIVEYERDWFPARQAAHMVGHRRGWRFKCRWEKKGIRPDGEPWAHGKIWRVE